MIELIVRGNIMDENVTLDELKQQIKSGQIAIARSSVKIIEQGEIKNCSGELVDYSISHGWDVISSIECDQHWTRARLELFQYIANQNFDEEKLSEILNSLQLEDSHWNWFVKSYQFVSNEYEWFYLYANNQPQGACLIYHPKDSALDTASIFYVEFIAVAPWNRTCLIREREFCGVGSILLKAALKFSVEQLNLTPGFSLHSLPQSKTFYEKLNMVNVEKNNKGTLVYFELPRLEANKLLEVV